MPQASSDMNESGALRPRARVCTLALRRAFGRDAPDSRGSLLIHFFASRPLVLRPPTLTHIDNRCRRGQDD